MDDDILPFFIDPSVVDKTLPDIADCGQVQYSGITDGEIASAAVADPWVPSISWPQRYSQKQMSPVTKRFGMGSYDHQDVQVEPVHQLFVDGLSPTGTQQEPSGSFLTKIATQSVSKPPPTQHVMATEQFETELTRRGRARKAARSKTKKASEWDQHKQIMTDLYMKEDMSLEDLRVLMRDSFGFEASYGRTGSIETTIANVLERAKQYKTRFASWGWAKNFTHELARCMNEKHNHRLRHGKSSSQFIWRNKTWTIDVIQKILTEEELEKSRNGDTGLPTPKTPLGLEVMTPEPTSPPTAPSTFGDEPLRSYACEASNAKIPSPHLIRIRYKGYTVENIAAILRTARELGENHHYEDAKAKFLEVLDVSKHLLPIGDDAYRKLVYAVASFFARNDDMEIADNILDDFSAAFLHEYEVSHEAILKHYAKLAHLLTSWSRHNDAIGLYKRIAESVLILVMTANRGSDRIVFSEPCLALSYMDIRTFSLENSSDNIMQELARRGHPIPLTFPECQFLADLGPDADFQTSLGEVVSQLVEKLNVSTAELAAKILRACHLLLSSCSRLRRTDNVAALRAMKNSIISLCGRGLQLTIPCFHISIDFAETMLEAEQQTAAKELLGRLAKKFTDYSPDDDNTVSIWIRLVEMICRPEWWKFAQPELANWLNLFSFEACGTSLANSLGQSIHFKATWSETAADQHIDAIRLETVPIHPQSITFTPRRTLRSFSMYH